MDSDNNKIISPYFSEQLLMELLKNDPCAKIIIPNSSKELFEEIASVNRYFNIRMDLIDGDLEIAMPVLAETGM